MGQIRSNRRSPKSRGLSWAWAWVEGDSKSGHPLRVEGEHGKGLDKMKRQFISNDMKNNSPGYHTVVVHRPINSTNYKLLADFAQAEMRHSHSHRKFKSSQYYHDMRACQVGSHWMQERRPL